MTKNCRVDDHQIPVDVLMFFVVELQVWASPVLQHTEVGAVVGGGVAGEVDGEAGGGEGATLTTTTEVRVVT